MSTTLPAAHIAVLGSTQPRKVVSSCLTRSLARQLAPRGVTVNSVAPGPTDTDMLVPEARAQLEVE